MLVKSRLCDKVMVQYSLWPKCNTHLVECDRDIRIGYLFVLMLIGRYHENVTIRYRAFNLPAGRQGDPQLHYNY